MNDWNQRYDTQEYLFGVQPAPFVTRHAWRIAPKSSILAVADGEGRNSVWLARQGHNVTAFDLSENALRKAGALAAAHNVRPEFILMGLDDFPWDQRRFDVVAAIFIQFVRPESWPGLWANLDEAIEPGGLLMLHGFAPRQVDYGTGGPPYRDNMYTLPLLQRAFPNYDVVYAADYDEDVSSGSGHNGRAGLIDIVARKPKLS